MKFPLSFGRRAARGCIFAAALAALVLARADQRPPSATAANEATISVSGSLLLVTDSAPNSASVTMSLNGTNYEFSGMPLIAGSGCTQVTPSSVTCGATPVSTVDVVLGDASDDSVDSLTVNSSADPISVTTGALDDAVTLGAGDLSAITSTVYIDGGDGQGDTLTLNDSALATPGAYVLGSTISRPGFPGVTQDQVDVLALTTGTQGDTVQVDSSPFFAGVTLSAGGGNDVITVGAGDLDLLGPVTVDGGPGTDTVHVDDSSSPVGFSYNITSERVFRGGIDLPSYSNIELLDVDAAAGDNSILIESTHASTPVELHAGDGNDVVQVGTVDLLAIEGPVSADGGPGASDEFRIDDGASLDFQHYVFERSRIKRDGVAAALYSGFELVELVASAGPGEVQILSTAEGAASGVNGFDDNDSFLISAPGLASTGSLEIVGGLHVSQDLLTFATGGLASVHQGTTISTPGKQDVSYQTIEGAFLVTDIDMDADGCSDVQESGLDPVLGGDRNPFDFSDFFDVNASQTIGLDDALAILGLFGLGEEDPGYDGSYDRYVPDASKRWRTAEAEGAARGITLQDALANLQSFGHDCS